MSRLDKEPQVRDLAKRLGLDRSGSAVEAIVAHCRRRVDQWVAEAGGVRSVEALEEIVAARLHLTMEEVWSDDDLAALIRKYLALKEPVFAYLKVDLDEKKYGVTLRRSTVGPDAPDRYVAVIDCRGEKAARRFFTRWHEIAHLLSAAGDLEGLVHRSRRDPLERLMDEIAGQVGYYGPLFDPVFDLQMRGKRWLTFEVVEVVRSEAFPEASFQATLSACCRRTCSPVLYVEAAMAHKAEDDRAIKQGVRHLFVDDQPVAKLRAVEVVPNPAAQKARFFIAPNMRIPEQSLIQRLCLAEGERSAVGEENLGTWEHSGDQRLPDQSVRIEARKASDRVIAIVQPTTT
jgi:hypothetical protein